MEAAAGQLRLDQIFPLPYDSETPHDRRDRPDILTNLCEALNSRSFAHVQHVAGRAGVSATHAVGPGAEPGGAELPALLQATFRQLLASSGHDWPQQV